MATIIWGGKSGNWNVGTLWTGATVPGTADTAEIDTSTGTDTILLNDARAVGGVTLNGANATLQLTGTLNLGAGGVLNAQSGTLVVAGTVTGGTLTPSGATIRFPSVDPVTKAVASPELANVAVNGTLDISASPVTLQAIGLGRSSLTGITIGAGSEILVLDGEIFSNQTIDLAGGVLAADAADPNNGSIFIGPGSTVLQNTPNTTARIGPDVVTALFGLGRVINQGTIIASAGTLLLDAEGGAFTSPFHQGPFTNTGAIQISGGATVVDDTNSTLAGLGTIVNNGGLLDLKGTLDNTGTTIDVAATGAFTNLLLDDTVTGGTIVEDGGTLAVGSASLQGVTVTGTGVAFNTLTIGKNTRFNPAGGGFTLTAQQTAYGQIFLNDGAVLSNARIAYGGTQFQANITLTGAAAPTATLDATTTLDVGAGQILRLDAGTGGTLVNNAVINVAAGGRLEFDNAATYTAGGTVNVAPGATVAFNGDIGLAALKNIVGTNATLINLGSLDLGGTTISTTGNSNFSSFVNEGVVANGTLVTVAGQNPNLGAIAGGATLDAGPGVLPVNTVNFANATLRGDVQLQVNGTLSISGDTTLVGQNGTGPGVIILNQQPSIFVLSSATSMQFNQSATLSHAMVLLSGITTNDLSGAFSAVPDVNANFFSTATFGKDTMLVATTVNGPISGLGNQGFYVNQGTIAVTPGADFFVVPYGSTTKQDFINQGTITIAAGGTFDVATNVSILSLGSVTGSGGLLRLDTNNVGNVPYDNTGNTIVVGGPTGAPDLELNASSITGGTIVNAGGKFTSINFGALNTVTYVGPLHIASGTDIFGNTATGALTFNGGTLSSQAVTIDSGGLLLLAVDQNFAGATLSLAGELADTGHTLGFDAATTVNITGSVYMPVGHLLNAGTINVGPGATLNLNDFGATATAEPARAGTIAVNGGTFTTAVLNSGQTLDLGPNSSVTIATRVDPGAVIDFQAPNTLNVGRSETIAGSILDFGAGDTINLTGYEDGLIYTFPPFSTDGVPHSLDTSTSADYDGNVLSVSRAGTVIASLPIGAGYTLSGFTIVPTGSTPSIANTAYTVTYNPPGAPPPVGPGIFGTVSKQATTDLVAVQPFSAVTITDLNVGAVITALVTLPGANGTATAPAGGTVVGGGALWVDTGDASAIESALRGLVFTPKPHQTTPGQAVSSGFSITLSDAFGTATDANTSVDATAVEDPIQLSGVTPLVLNNPPNVNAAQPFHQIAIVDPDNATFTATATLADRTYASFGLSFNAKVDNKGVYSTSGNLATVTQALHDLVAYTTEPPLPTGQSASTTVSLTISDGVSQTVSATSTIQIVSAGTADAAGLAILGTAPGQTTSDQSPIAPFSSVVLIDKTAGTLDTVTVTMSDAANGTLVDAAGGTINSGTFTASATVDSTGFVSGIDTVLDALNFIPTRGQVPFGQSVTTVFTIVASNKFGSTTDASTSVIATDASGQLAIGGAQANQELTDNSTALPLSGVTITDTQIAPTETASVALSNPASGTLTVGNGGTVGSDGVFRVSGPLASVQSALRAVGFKPAAQEAAGIATSGVTISVVDGSLNATDTTTSLIVVGSGAAGTITPAPAAAGLSSSGPALAVGTVANSFLLNLGTVLVGATAAPVTLNASNTATGTADALSGSFSINDPGGFINNGFVGFAALVAGGTATAGTITLTTGTAGTFSETITLSPTDLNGDSGSVLPGQTVTVQAVVASVVPAPAIEVLNSIGTIGLPNVRVDALDRQAVSLSNGAGAPASTLSVTPVAVGQATASGTIGGLGAGATDATSILVGIDTTAAGARSGTVTLNGSSVDGGGTATPLAGPPIVSVSGNVYRTGSGTISPIATIVHVGDPGTVALSVANTAAADGFSESLIANLLSVPPGFSIAASGPTGDILAGASDASTLRVGFSTAAAGTVTGTVTVGMTSDGGAGTGSLDGLGTLALPAQGVPVAVTVDNFANPVFENFANVGTLSGSGTAFTLNLGTIAQGTGPFTAGIDVRNLVSGPADALTGSLAVSGSGAFNNSGLASIGTLGAGTADIAPAITLATDTPGIFSETITLTPTGSNAGGFSASLPSETLTVTGTVVPPLIPPAIATIVSGGTIDFGAVHLGALAQQALDIANAATAGSAALDASVSSASGSATASGSFAGVAPGADNKSGILVGLNTGIAGVRSGGASLAFVSDGGTFGSVSLPGQIVAVSGTVYREATAALSPLTATVHVGDPGTIVLPIANSDPNDGYSEQLIAVLAAASGGLGIAASGPTADIAAGSTDRVTLALAFSTALAGTIAGSATVDVVSDGGGIDGLGLTTLAAQTTPVTIVVDNFAVPVITSGGGGLTAQGANSFLLNLGTATVGDAALTAGLNIGNGATGAADLLNGAYAVSGSGQFGNSGFGAFGSLAAGGSLSAGVVTLATSQAGVFTETITLSPIGSNAGSFAGVLPADTITVTGTIIAPAGTATGDVHMLTFAGTRYDFQAVGGFVLARSTVPGDTFQIQIETAASWTIDATSVTTEAAASVGSHVVTFAIGRDAFVWLDGAPDTALSAANPVQGLGGGRLQALSTTVFRLSWSSGETLTVTDVGPYLDDAVSLGPSDGPGSVEGLLGSNSGRANDFRLADGGVLAGPLNESDLAGAFANAWRVTPASSLLGDTPMQFIRDGAVVTEATAPGQSLSAGEGVAVLSDAGGFGATFQGTLADLVGTAIEGFSRQDVFDIGDLDNATATHLEWSGSSADGVLHVGDGFHSGDLRISGRLAGAGFHAMADGHGGVLIGLT